MPPLWRNGKRESEVHKEWAASAKNVTACLSIIGSFQYKLALSLQPDMKSMSFC